MRDLSPLYHEVCIADTSRLINTLLSCAGFRLNLGSFELAYCCAHGVSLRVPSSEIKRVVLTIILLLRLRLRIWLLFLDFVEESAQAVLGDGRRHLLRRHALAHSTAWRATLIKLAVHHVWLGLLLRHALAHHVGHGTSAHLALSSTGLHHHVHLHHHLLHLLLHLLHHWIVCTATALQVHLLHALLHHLHLHLHLLLLVWRAAGPRGHHAWRGLLRLLRLLQGSYHLVEWIVHVLVLSLHLLGLEPVHIGLESNLSGWLGRLLGLLWLRWRTENIVEHIPRWGGWRRLSCHNWLLRSGLLWRELWLRWLLRSWLPDRSSKRTKIAPVISKTIACASRIWRRSDRLRRSHIKQILHIICFALNGACSLGRHSLSPWRCLRLCLLGLWLLLSRCNSGEISS